MTIIFWNCNGLLQVLPAKTEIRELAISIWPTGGVSSQLQKKQTVNSSPILPNLHMKSSCYLVEIITNRSEFLTVFIIVGGT